MANQFIGERPTASYADVARNALNRWEQKRATDDAMEAKVLVDYIQKNPQQREAVMAQVATKNPRVAKMLAGFSYDTPEDPVARMTRETQLAALEGLRGGGAGALPPGATPPFAGGPPMDRPFTGGLPAMRGPSGGAGAPPMPGPSIAGGTPARPGGGFGTDPATLAAIGYALATGTNPNAALTTDWTTRQSVGNDEYRTGMLRGLGAEMTAAQRAQLAQEDAVRPLTEAEIRSRIAENNAQAGAAEALRTQRERELANSGAVKTKSAAAGLTDVNKELTRLSTEEKKILAQYNALIAQTGKPIAEVTLDDINDLEINDKKMLPQYRELVARLNTVRAQLGQAKQMRDRIMAGGATTAAAPIKPAAEFPPVIEQGIRRAMEGTGKSRAAVIAELRAAGRI